MATPSSLTDVTASNQPNEAPKSAEPAQPAQPNPVDKDAAEVGRIILDSGYSKEQLNDLLQAPGALNQLRYMVENDPKAFQQMLERASPELGARFLDQMTNLYLERYGNESGNETPADGKPAVGSEVQDQLRLLQERIDQSEQKERQREQAAHLATVESRYNARVDDLFKMVPKELTLTKSQEKALRSELQAELNSDPSARQRVLNGNFVDVPLKFQSLVTDWVNDQKAQQTALEDQRKQIQSGAGNNFLSGPAQALMPTDTSADSWDNTERDLAAAFKKLGMGA